MILLQELVVMMFLEVELEMIHYRWCNDDTLTGDAGNDTFNVDSGSDTITDLATNDDLVVSSGATATANNVSAFVADSDTTNAGTATINAARVVRLP